MKVAVHCAQLSVASPLDRLSRLPLLLLLKTDGKDAIAAMS